MSVFAKILPFYGIIENPFSTAGRVVEKKVEGNEQRKTLKAKAEIEVFVKTEYEKKLSEIRQNESNLEHEHKLAEKGLEHSQGIEKMKVQADLTDLPNRREHERQIEFEKHRVDLFERIKTLEFAIKREISEFDEGQQKKLLIWHSSIMRSLEEESQKALVVKLPEVLHMAMQFREDEEVYSQFKKRAFMVIDNTIESIRADQELFRSSLTELNNRHKQMTEVMIEMSKKFEIAHINQRLIAAKN